MACVCKERSRSRPTSSPIARRERDGHRSRPPSLTRQTPRTRRRQHRHLSAVHVARSSRRTRTHGRPAWSGSLAQTRPELRPSPGSALSPMASWHNARDLGTRRRRLGPLDHLDGRHACRPRVVGGGRTGGSCSHRSRSRSRLGAVDRPDSHHIHVTSRPPGSLQPTSRWINDVHKPARVQMALDPATASIVDRRRAPALVHGAVRSPRTPNPAPECRHERWPNLGIPPFRGGIVYEETPCQSGGSMTPSSVRGQ